MTEPGTYLPDREAWKHWLEENHDKESLVWLIYYKKHTGKPSISYNDAVEEALCWGWIDSLVRRIDEDRYMQKFTPRKPKSTWSRHNVRRVEKMIREGRMKSPGLDLYTFARDNGLLPDPEGDTPVNSLFPEIPGYISEAFNENAAARKFFDSLAPSYKLQYLGWIMSAKKQETRISRLEEAIQLLNEGKKLGMK